jgi:CDP-diacylglycerol--glycerol-3-phosphate 3-phosphatidyltransferase
VRHALDDRVYSLALLGGAALLFVAYAVRVAVRGRVRFARVRDVGGSVLLAEEAMTMVYWALEPVGAACVALGIGANTVTLASLAIALGAAAAIANGALGLGAALSLAASAGDALDGWIARRTGVASDAGEVLDASVDRYAELFVLGGFALYYRGDALALGLTLGALGGSFMVSYASARAEGLGVTPPRGAMRRPERAAYLTAGATLTPLTGEGPMRVSPALVAIALVAIVGNVSAVLRLRAIARAVSMRDARASAKSRRIAASMQEERP